MREQLRGAEQTLMSTRIKGYIYLIETKDFGKKMPFPNPGHMQEAFLQIAWVLFIQMQSTFLRPWSHFYRVQETTKAEKAK